MGVGPNSWMVYIMENPAFYGSFLRETMGVFMCFPSGNCKRLKVQVAAVTSKRYMKYMKLKWQKP